MVKFIPVRYQKYNYPPIPNTEPKIQEITANFFNFFKHKETLQETDLPYHLSLHTDPGYRGNKDLFISSQLLKEFPVLSRNVTDFGKTCISKLWCNKEWSEEFAHFLIKLTEGIDRKKVKVIEIHPPFDIDYNSLDTFIEIYKIFEDEALKEFPSTIINIENRCNPNIKKKGGKFLLSSTDDIKELSDLISKSPLKLKLQLIVYIPQLLSEHQMLSGRPGNPILSEREIKEVMQAIRAVRHNVSGTHIWGYDINEKRGAHKADFNTYFNNDQELKKCFLQEIRNLFDDDKKRYFVPEVNGKAKVQSIVNDLIKEGITFVEPD